MKLPLAAWPGAALTVARTFGLRAGAQRARHELRRATNRFRRVPRKQCGPLNDHCVFLRADRARVAKATDTGLALARADRVLAGCFEAYRSDWRALPRTPEEWLKHPVTGVESRSVPWWRIDHLDPSFGDIKDVWEPARFGFAYDLVRGFLVTGDEQYAASFAKHFRSWLASSPPFHGVHWSCGQESAIRAIALLYAEANFGDELIRRLQLAPAIADTLAATGERIADAIDYGLSQRNNHGISEAAGLVAIGVRLRDAHPDAHRWVDRGAALLEDLVVQQFAEDGWYIQHSFSYLRLALDQCVVAERALRSIGRCLGERAVSRLRAAVRLIGLVIEPESGILPNHGAVDGAFVHPITLAGYRDYRPVLTAAAATWHAPVASDIELDDEVLAWLGWEAPARIAPPADGALQGASGWVVARLGAHHVFMCAPRYTTRPGHLDSLHLDVRIHGREVIVDPGTYAYNARPPWRNALSSATVHNGPLPNGREPGIRGPRFLWYRWPQSRVLTATHELDRLELVAELDSSVRRTVVVTEAGISITDVAIGQDVESLTACWLFHPDADPAIFRLERGAGALQWGSEGDVRGWFSSHYGQRVPTHFMVASSQPGPDSSLRAYLMLPPPAVRMANDRDSIRNSNIEAAPSTSR